MLYFCTYFDQNYLSRGLALYRSLRTQSHNAILFVLCMDATTFDSLYSLALPGIVPIGLDELEANDTELQGAKTNRSRIEYYFTSTPSLPLYIMEKWAEVELITYLDADLFFFSDPQPLFDELGPGSIGMIAHRFPPRLRDRERYGLYNVGWLSFRRDENGLACLRWWRERCIEWCYDREEDGRFADQKYLDDWPSRFANVVVLQHPGANVAPWNVDTTILRNAGDSVMVGSQPLIFFHFHGLKQIGRWLYDPSWKEYGVNPSFVLRNQVYIPYIRVLREVTRSLLSLTKRASAPIGVRHAASPDRSRSPARAILSRFRKSRDITRDVVAGELILTFGAL
jgi:hypothetical protein